jgi:hypothetical protein
MDKPKLVEIEGTELDAIMARRGDLDVPPTFSQRIDNRIHFYADADELRAWRSAQSKSALESQHGK